MKKDNTPSMEEITGRPPRPLMVVISSLGLLAIAVATLMPILNVWEGPGAAGTWWKWLYAGGALLFLIGKLLSPYTGKELRLKRLARIESWSAIFFCVAAFFLFYNGNVSRDSWAFTLAGAAILVFTNIQIPRTIRKLTRKN